MLINGQGITQFNCQINRDFTIETSYSLNFFELSNGGWGCIDRSSVEDDYQTVVNIIGTEQQIYDLQTKLENNRYTGNEYTKNVLILSGFNEAEKIFGCDIDYSKDIITTAIIERRIQRTLNTFSIELRLHSQDLSFVLPNNISFPRLNFISTGYDADSDKSINKMFSLNNFFWIRDHDYDKGTFSGTVQLSNQEMMRVRYNHRVDRGIPITIPTLSGVNKPFGIRNSNTNVRLLEITDETIIGINCGDPVWTANLTFTEEF